MHEAEEGGDERRLSAAGATAYSYLLAGGDLEVDAAEGRRYGGIRSVRRRNVAEVDGALGGPKGIGKLRVRDGLLVCVVQEEADACDCAHGRLDLSPGEDQDADSKAQINLRTI